MKRVFKLDSSFLEFGWCGCRPGLDWFEDKFPEGVVITNNQQEMFELCERVLDNAEDTLDGSASFLEWLCIGMRDILFNSYVYFDSYVYFGSSPRDTSYNDIGYDNYLELGYDNYLELSSREPEHCALIICSFVDKFGKTNASSRVCSTK